MGKTAVAAAMAVVMLATLFTVGMTTAQESPAAAAVRSDFNPGNIISDAVFYDSSTMSVAEIQAFLNSRVSSCVPGYTCLKDYRQAFPSKSARAEGCSAIAAADNLTAADIIYRVSKSCGVNPRVLLTLLEKEQSLVSSTAPSDGRYRAATGYGCPDTAACDAEYYGFVNQVYNAARQFKYYRYTQNSWNYRAGQVNTILWHPNADCGTSQVYIENQATAGLYIYTPYRPNDAALNNLYGTGDACSSYGNRNFWRIFTDWFGSTTGNIMVRASDSLQIWIISNGTKYPINNPEIYQSLTPLGAVATVTPSYLTSLPTGPEVSRFVGDSSGNLYYVDSGKRYHFDSCSRAVDWGYSCPNWTPLETSIVQKLANAGELSNVVRDASLRYWQITKGTRKQAVDAGTLAAVDGNPLTRTSNAGITHLPTSTPLLRNDIVIRQAGTAIYALYTNGTATAMAETLATQSILRTRIPQRSLTAESFKKLAITATSTGVFSSTSNALFLMAETGKVRLANSAVLGLGATPVSTALLAKLPTLSGTISDPAFLRGVGTPSVYSTSAGVRHHVSSWDEYVKLAAAATNGTTYVIPQSVISAIPEGTAYIRPGSVVRAQGTPAAFLVDGAQRLIPISNYDITAQLGFGSVAHEVPATTIASFPKATTPLTRHVTCGGKVYLGVDGSLRPASSAMQKAYGLTAPYALDATTCATVRTGTALKPFVHAVDNGGLYYMSAGQRRYVPTGEIATALGATDATLTPMKSVGVKLLPLGTPLISPDVSKVPVFIRGAGTPEVYLLRDGVRSWVQTPDDLAYAAKQLGTSTVTILPPFAVNELPRGSAYVRAGKFVRSSDGPTVYLIDGASSLIVLNSWDPYDAIGGEPVVDVDPSTLAGYTVEATAPLGSVLTCGADTYIGLGGELYLMTDEVIADFGQPAATTLSAETCETLPHAAGEPGNLIADSRGTLYQMEGGVRHEVTTPLEFAFPGDSEIPEVSDYTLSLFPEGDPIK